ncbi:hypothetical protein EAH86_08395 [Pedococcus bigeumensis]|uniref:Uncharacterized protein n=1 Tax=Pedococcus bigeumensis TaxID=433644 RepID=A0A502CT57_9MICO|nr:hypothetical protein EAH86_08395 [Pedococcus bigeumensis]
MLSSPEFFWNVALGILMARHATDSAVARRNLAHLATACGMPEGEFARFLVLLTDAQARLGRPQ